MNDQSNTKNLSAPADAPKPPDTTLAAFIWKNAEDLWGDFKHTDFGKIILPFTLLRRLECVLEPSRDAVRAAHAKFKDKGLDTDLILRQTAGLPFYNTSLYSFATLGATKTKSNLEAYVAGFSDNARVIFDQFNFTDTIARLARADILFKICQNFANTDLHPDVVPDRVMSNIYEHLIRRFGAEVNEAAEDFMTPRDVVHLATTLLLDPDDALFRNSPGLIRTLYDPTCGTGGFLTDAMNHVDGYTARGKAPPVLIPFGQELEPETHAVGLANMLLRRLETDPARDLSANIAGPKSTLSQDAFADKRFHYCLANPPFGKKWEKDQAFVEREFTEKGFDGRFGAGTPRVSDGSMLFVQHLVDKLERPAKGGGRAAIILSGSPLFTGNAGHGESEIRRWLLENDYIETIVALPTDIFFRTGISTYVWILTNKKPEERKGKVQLIDATGLHSPMLKAEGNKRRIISDEQIRVIARLYADFQPGQQVRIVDYRDFGYRRIRVQRPLRLAIKITADGIQALQSSKAFAKLGVSEQARWLGLLNEFQGQTLSYAWLAGVAELAQNSGLPKIGKSLTAAFEDAFGVRDANAPEAVDSDGDRIPDKELEEFENVPLHQAIGDYMATEVLPHVPDAWVDEGYTDDRDGEVGKVGYEINFNRYFYKYLPPRDLRQIDAELKAVESEITQTTYAVTKGLDQSVPMKRSGVQWLGSVPAHWSMVQSRRLFAERNEKARAQDIQLTVSQKYGLIPQSEFMELEGRRVVVVQKGHDILKRAYVGDFVMSMRSFQGGLEYSRFEGAVSSAYVPLTPIKWVVPRYFRWLLKSVTYIQALQSTSDLVRDGQALRFENFAKVPLPVVPVVEQEAIADFLDSATARVDSLIAKTERYIELLREHRTALITAAVTGNIDVRKEA